MKVYREVNSVYDFEFWSGADDTIKKVIEADKEDEFWDFIEEYFSETELNDFVWFESDYIYEHIGLTEDGELPEDEEEDEEDEEEDEEDMED